LDRVVALFGDAPDGPVVDGTLGAGGHAAAIGEARIARYGHAHLVGLDRDPDALELARRRWPTACPRREVDLVRTRFDALPDVLDDLGLDRVAGVFLDLGISSMHVDRAERGFSYRQQGPLDMRMDPDLATTAADLVNDLDGPRAGPDPATVRRRAVRRPHRPGHRRRASLPRRRPSWRRWSATPSRRPHGGPAATPRPGPSRRCGSR
jgi:hypothetical protein